MSTTYSPPERTCRLEIKLNDHELRAIRLAAERAGLSASEYVRLTCAYGVDPIVPFNEEPA